MIKIRIGEQIPGKNTACPSRTVLHTYLVRVLSSSDCVLLESYVRINEAISSPGLPRRRQEVGCSVYRRLAKGYENGIKY